MAFHYVIHMYLFLSVVDMETYVHDKQEVKREGVLSYIYSVMISRTEYVDKKNNIRTGRIDFEY